jgi:hypothetical protein
MTLPSCTLEGEVALELDRSVVVVVAVVLDPGSIS